MVERQVGQPGSARQDTHRHTGRTLHFYKYKNKCIYAFTSNINKYIYTVYILIRVCKSTLYISMHIWFTTTIL